MNKRFFLIIKIQTFLVSLFIVNLSFCQIQNDMINKNLLSVERYSFPFCINNKKNCIGYTEDDIPGPNPKVSGILIQEDSILVIDSDNLIVLKISLENGKIIRKSERFPYEYYSGGLREIIYLETSVLVLSGGSSFFYELDTNLQIKNSFEIPNHGTHCEFYKKDSSLYIIRGKTLWETKDSEAHLAFHINKDLSLTNDTIITKSPWFIQKRIYGEEVNVFEDVSGCYFQTNNIIYETPELIPQFDEYLRSVGYNEKYLVYFVLLEDEYEMVVCKYL